MRALACPLPCVAVLALLLLPAPAAAQQPADVVRRGKAATALVEVKGRRSHATAFCIHPAGLFLTNEHAVRHAGEAGTVTLVLDPSLKTQRVVTARVLRADRELDLALLRAEPEGKFPTLPLGSSDGLTELTPVTALGFPFGKSLALEKGTYPAVSVNRGQVTSLRRKGGELWRVQLDAVLNPGNSGGPVLDARGNVVGVVVSGVLGAQVNFAIPVSHVRRFVARPDLDLLAPPLRHPTRHQPALFRVKVVEVLPGADRPALELILDSGDGAPRSHKMERDKDGYRITAPPVPAPKGPVPLRISLRYDSGLVQGLVSDRAFKVGGKEVKLSEAVGLQFRPKPRVTLAGGEAAEGPVTGLDAVPVRLGGEELRLDLTRAAQVSVEHVRAVTAVRCTVVATRGGKEVARLTRTLPVEGLPVAGVGTGPVGIEPVLLDRPTVVRPLPAPVSDLCVGGGGRYLILHMPRVRALAVFDVSQARIVQTIPGADEDIRFAAGMDKLIVLHPSKKVLQRWSLTGRQREALVPLPFKMDRVLCVAMGCASDGPLFVGGPVDDPKDLSKPRVALLDVQTLKPLPLTKVERHGIGFGEPTPVRASANGRVFTTWRQGGSPQGIQVFALEGTELRTWYVGSTPGHCVPGQDGKHIFTSLLGIHTTDAKNVEGSNKDGRCGAVPAHNAPFFLGIRALEPGRQGKDADKGVRVYLVGDPRPLATLPEVSELGTDLDAWGRTTLTLDKRLHFVPEAKVIITLPKENDRLVLRRFDVDEALAKSGVDYLLVTSDPPASARRGATYRYQMAVKSRKGGVECRLGSGPKGLQVSAAGLVTWEVPAGFRAAEAEVLISVTDASGQEAFHTFKIQVRD
jgi:S1-C subfamily serine protease